MTMWAMYDENEQCLGVFEYVRDACKIAGIKKHSFYSQMSRGATNTFMNGTSCTRVEVDE